MQEHEKRVVIERDELRAKRDMLVKFFSGDLFGTLAEEDQRLLTEQAVHMLAYENVLVARILRFNGDS